MMTLLIPMRSRRELKVRSDDAVHVISMYNELVYLITSVSIYGMTIDLWYEKLVKPTCCNSVMCTYICTCMVSILCADICVNTFFLQSDDMSK